MLGVSLKRRGGAVWPAALLALLASGAAGAQELDELIRTRVEQLAETGQLEAAGAALSARKLIPEIYAARAFTPAWRSAAQVESLLEAIAEAQREGLDPADYHTSAVERALERFAAIESVPAAERAETVFLEAPVDLLLLYWTTEVDAAGRVYFWPDLYERDAAVIAGLGQPFRPGPTL